MIAQVIIDAVTSGCRDGTGSGASTSLSASDAAFALTFLRGRFYASVEAPLPARSAHPSVLATTYSDAAALFNQKPRLGIACLEQSGMFPAPLSASNKAHFLRFARQLDKTAVRESICLHACNNILLNHDEFKVPDTGVLHFLVLLVAHFS